MMVSQKVENDFLRNHHNMIYKQKGAYLPKVKTPLSFIVFKKNPHAFVRKKLIMISGLL